ncbi:hypothetical protein AFK68_13955 [Hydrocoleum sp. CS-953]|nr:hypothetical protein AFK68_13955 [Hydrocoleum sp. CS-953]
MASRLPKMLTFSALSIKKLVLFPEIKLLKPLSVIALIFNQQALFRIAILYLILCSYLDNIKFESNIVLCNLTEIASKQFPSNANYFR